MKYSFLFLLLCTVIIIGLKLWAMNNVSPIILFCVSIGPAMIIVFAGFMIFGKQKKENDS